MINIYPKTFLIAVLFVIAGCGSFEKEKVELLDTKEPKDLVNVFNVSEDQAEKFKEEAVSPVEVTVVEKKEQTASVVPQKKEKTKAKKGAKASEKKMEKPEVKPNAVEAVKAISGYSYPHDYPQILKDYDQKSESVWALFKPAFFQGEQSIMAINYLGVTAGYITITSVDLKKINEKPVYHYYARFKSRDAYRYFYWLDDTIETFIEKDTFLPMKYSLVQREKKQNVDDLQLFDFKKLKTFHWYKRVKTGSNRDEKIENYIPRFAQDSFSALQFVRGLPMKKGDRYEFPVITRGKPWLLKIEVMGEEVTSVDGKDVKAYKLRAETHFPGVLQKSGDINFWYSADDIRRLLKFQAKVKIGSIFGELVEYKPGVLVK